MYILEKLNAKKVTDLRTIANELNISEYEKLKKQELAAEELITFHNFETF